jgi:hypothetical protein
LIPVQQERLYYERFFSEDMPHIKPDMTVLAVLQLCRQTEAVFKKYEAPAGNCIMCTNLFDPLRVVAQTYGLDLRQLLADLEVCAGSAPRSSH